MLRSLPVITAAAAWFVLTASLAHAQSRGPYIPPDAKGYRAQQIMQAWQQAARTEAATAARPVVTRQAAPTSQPADVQIAVSTPPGTAAVTPATVALRGPDGEVRTFPVEGGREALQSRVVVVRPGQTVTIRVMLAR